VVESSGLLNRRRPLKSTGGSNPPLSARRKQSTYALRATSVGQYRSSRISNRGMALALCRRHRRGCKARYPEEFCSSEYDEQREGWKSCECPIFVSGALARRFTRQTTGQWEWEPAIFVSDPVPLALPRDGRKRLAAPHEAIQLLQQHLELRFPVQYPDQLEIDLSWCLAIFPF
jgi:hypothetical protein